MNELDSPFFVEFVGIPGSGKSTLSKRLANKLGECRLPFNEPIYRINEDSHPYLRPLYKLPYVASGISENINHSYKYFKFVRYHNLNLKLLFNWLFVKGVGVCYSKRNGITLYDQGLIQALWSFLISESTETVNFFQDLLFKNYPPVTVLFVCVEADTKTVENRLRQRTSNRSRIRTGMNVTYNVNDAVRAYVEVNKTIESLVNTRPDMHKLTVINEGSLDLYANVETITSEIKRMY